MTGRLRPFLSVHCWGGLGSQLFAWALVEDLKIKYPTRKFRLVLHQSGVTKRTEEIAEFFPGECVIRADFVPQKNEYQPHDARSESSPYKSLKTLLVAILYFLKIFSRCDADTTLDSVKFWTLQIRGHYSYRQITSATIAAMDARAKLFSKRLISNHQINTEGLAIQYRLGDLLTLGSKGPIDSSRISTLVASMKNNHEIPRIVVFSDSPEEALIRFAGMSVESVGEELSAWSTLGELQLFEHFISTNSKISIWVILIRTYYFPQLTNFAPKEFRQQFTFNMALTKQAESITYY